MRVINRSYTTKVYSVNIDRNRRLVWDESQTATYSEDDLKRTDFQDHLNSQKFVLVYPKRHCNYGPFSACEGDYWNDKELVSKIKKGKKLILAQLKTD